MIVFEGLDENERFAVRRDVEVSPAELEAYALLRGAIATISGSLLFPSLGLVLISGLLAMAATRAYRDVGWVWLKLLLGVSVFEGTLVAIHGPAVRAAEMAPLSGQDRKRISALYQNQFSG